MLSMLQRALLASSGGKKPIELIGTAAGSGGNQGYSFAADAVNGAQAGDLQLLVAAGVPNVTTDPSSLTGWTTVFSDMNVISSPSSWIGLYLRELSSSDVSVEGAVQNAWQVAITAVLRNAEYVSHSNSAAGSATPPAVSMDKGDWSVVLFSYITNQISNAPTGYSNGLRDQSGGSSGPGAHMAFKLITSSGTETPGSFTGVSTRLIRATTIRLKRA